MTKLSRKINYGETDTVDIITAFYFAMLEILVSRIILAGTQVFCNLAVLFYR